MKLFSDLREHLANTERRIARLERSANNGLTCCGELGGIRSRSSKRKLQIFNRRIQASIELGRLVAIRNSLKARIENGETIVRPKISKANRSNRLSPRRNSGRIDLTYKPKITATCKTVDEANRYMESHPGEGVLISEDDGTIKLARVDDVRYL